MAPVIDAIVLGGLLGLASWLIKRRRPDYKLKRLRRLCRTHLARALRPRWEFVQIIRLASELFGPGDVAVAAGVPITLVFDWQDFTFGSPPEEVWLRGAAVEAILKETGCAVWWEERKRLGPMPPSLVGGVHKDPIKRRAT